ncbi:MAG TPA: hypothetical protein VGA67_06095 [Candidatus Dojkabacteria bacterium]|jgi:hypothetical protein
MSEEFTPFPRKEEFEKYYEEIVSGKEHTSDDLTLQLLDTEFSQEGGKPTATINASIAIDPDIAVQLNSETVDSFLTWAYFAFANNSSGIKFSVAKTIERNDKIIQFMHVVNFTIGRDKEIAEVRLGGFQLGQGNDSQIAIKGKKAVDLEDKDGFVEYAQQICAITRAVERSLELYLNS